MAPTTNPVSKPSTASKSKSKVKTGAKNALGAPSQHTQGSRKGKRAWRKNVDIGEVEEGMEGLRAEERVVGSVSMNLDGFSLTYLLRIGRLFRNKKTMIFSRSMSKAMKKV